MKLTVIESAEASLQALMRSSNSTIASFELTAPEIIRGYKLCKLDMLRPPVWMM